MCWPMRNSTIRNIARLLPLFAGNISEFSYFAGWQAFYVSQDADSVEGQHSRAAGYFALDDAGRRKLGIPRVDKHEYARETGWGILGLLAYYTQYPGPGRSRCREESRGVGDRQSLDRRRRISVMTRRTLPALILEIRWPWAARSWASTKRRRIANGSSAPWRRRTSSPRISAPGRRNRNHPPALRPLLLLLPICFVPSRRWMRMFLPPGFSICSTITPAASRTPRRRTKRCDILPRPQVARSRGLFCAGILVSDVELNVEPLHVTIVGKKSDPGGQGTLHAGCSRFYRLSANGNLGCIRRAAVESRCRVSDVAESCCVHLHWEYVLVAVAHRRRGGGEVEDSEVERPGNAQVTAERQRSRRDKNGISPPSVSLRSLRRLKV